MVRRFGFPTLDAAIGKVEYPGLDLSRVRWDGGSNFPNNDRVGVRVPAHETGLADVYPHFRFPRSCARVAPASFNGHALVLVFFACWPVAVLPRLP